MKFIMLINVKMPTIVGILKTFVSIINTTSECFKQVKNAIFQYFTFYKELKFRGQLCQAWKKFYNLGARLCGCIVWTAPLLFA